MLNNGLSVHYLIYINIELQLNYSDIHIILYGNKKDIYNLNPKSITSVKNGVISKFIQNRNIIYEEGCALSDDNLC
jgi:hypothetical protein